MLGNDSLGVLRRDVAIPCPLWIHDAYRPVNANPQAIALGAVAGAIRAGDVQLLHPLLNVFPSLLALLRRGAVGPKADKQMALELTDAKLRRDDRWGKFVRVGHAGYSMRLAVS